MNQIPGTTGRKLRLGVLGAGMIAIVQPGFLPGMRQIADKVEVAAITSRTRSRAEGVAAEFDIPAVYDDLTTMLAEADLDAVLNLTPIDAHYETNMQILEAGKHLVSEKPFAQTMREANDICELARSKGLLVVVAPADMLRNEWVESRRLVRSGALGKIAFARVQSSHAGPAAMSWPADPTWFYQAGSGPLLDMGAYGLTRVTGVLGPAKRVSAMSGITVPVRRARGGPFDGLEIPVTEADNNVLLLDFGDATFATVDATFNVVGTRAPEMEIYGLEGSLVVNRPDTMPLPGQLSLELYRIDAAAGLSGWVTPRTIGRSRLVDRIATLQRAVLVEHLVECLASGEQPLVGADHARHVLEIMNAAKVAAQEGRTVSLETTF
ncbi:MAG: Gfo/Idh/MocA family oxidoreductase [Chloroflexota bacterium]